jgi:hypothetical protein
LGKKENLPESSNACPKAALNGAKKNMTTKSGSDHHQNGSLLADVVTVWYSSCGISVSAYTCAQNLCSVASSVGRAFAKG